MRPIWTICAAAACVAALAATQTEFTLRIIVTAVATIVVSWL